jgi:hypothetical protein
MIKKSSMIRYLMKCRQIGDKVRENGWNTRHDVCMYEPNASDPNNPQGRAKIQEPTYRDLVLDIKIILLYGTIVPHAHHHHENEGQGDGYPSPFAKFDKGC